MFPNDYSYTNFPEVLDKKIPSFKEKNAPILGINTLMENLKKHNPDQNKKTINKVFENGGTSLDIKSGLNPKVVTKVIDFLKKDEKKEITDDEKKRRAANAIGFRALFIKI